MIFYWVKAQGKLTASASAAAEVCSSMDLSERFSKKGFPNQMCLCANWAECMHIVYITYT